MNRTTLFLVICVLGLGGFIFWDMEQHGTSTRSELEKRAFQIDVQDCNYVMFIKNRVQIECTRDGGEWLLAEPAGARARSAALERILSRLERLEKGSVITEEQQKREGIKLKTFGLDRPAASFVVGGDNSPRRSFWIGSLTPLGNQLYVQEDGNPDVIVVTSDLLQLIPDKAVDLRDRALGIPSVDKLTRIEIKRQSGFVQFERKSDGVWELRQPVQAPVDQERFTAMLDRLTSVRVEEFITNNPEAGAYGLNDPVVEVTWYTGEESQSGGLKLGASREDVSDQLFGKLDGLPTVFAISEGLKQNLESPVDDLRDRRLIPIDPNLVTALRILNGEEVITLELSDEKTWSISEPMRAEADEAKIRRLLSDWFAVNVLSFIPNTPLEPKAPADGSKVAASKITELVFQYPVDGSEAGVEHYHLKIHHDKAKAGRLLIERPAEAEFVEVPFALMASLSLNPLTYRTHQVLNLGTGDIIRFSRQSGDELIELERGEDGVGEWSSTRGNQKVLVAGLGPLLGTCQKLTAVELIKQDPDDADLKAYGLSSPLMTLTLGLTEEAGIRKQLLLGNTVAGGRTYAMILGQDLVFKIDSSQVSRLSQPIVMADTGAPPEPPPVKPPEVRSASELPGFEKAPASTPKAP